MKNLIKILFPICGVAVSTLPLTLVSCGPEDPKPEPENYIKLNKWNAKQDTHYLESESYTLTQGIVYGCVIDYSKWGDDWSTARPSFTYIGESGLVVRPTWIEAQNVWLKKDNKWELVDDKNYIIIESIGFLNLTSDFSRKLSSVDQIKIDIIVNRTADYIFSAR